MTMTGTGRASAAATVLLLVSVPLVAGEEPPIVPIDNGPDGGYGMDAPNASTQGFPIGSGTSEGALSAASDRDWYRVVSFYHTTGVLVQLFGTSSCMLVQILKQPYNAISASTLVSQVLCPNSFIAFQQNYPGVAQWFIGYVGGNVGTYKVHVQVYGGF